MESIKEIVKPDEILENEDKPQPLEVAISTPLTQNKLVYFENALAKIPAFDIGSHHMKNNKRLEFRWTHETADGKKLSAFCYVDPVQVESSGGKTVQRLAADFENDLFLFLTDRFANQEENDNEWIRFGYEDLGNFLGYKPSTYRSGSFREEVKLAIRTLAKVKIVAKNSWFDAFGKGIEAETQISYIENYKFLDVKDSGATGRGKKDTILVNLGSHHRKNIKGRNLSALTADMFPKLKGSAAVRRLAHVVQSRIEEASNPQILYLYLEDLRVSMAIDPDWPSFRAKEKLKRLFSAIKRAGMIADDPIFSSDSSNRDVIEIKPIYHVTKPIEGANDALVQRFIRSLHRFRKIPVPECGLSKAQIKTLLDLYPDKERYQGISVPVVLAVIESLLVQYSVTGFKNSKGQQVSFVPLVKSQMMNLKEFTFVEANFRPVLVREIEEEAKLDKIEVEKVKERDERLLQQEATKLLLDHPEHFRSLYWDEITKPLSQTQFGQKKIEMFKDRPSEIDPWIVTCVMRDLKAGKREILPLEGRGPVQEALL